MPGSTRWRKGRNFAGHRRSAAPSFHPGQGTLAQECVGQREASLATRSGSRPVFSGAPACFGRTAMGGKRTGRFGASGETSRPPSLKAAT